ncbi:unnamed protein product [Paramecium octaurelia]|uniref:Uncharacterized protein n=1 Tax=Paramecium octaurelia TaxID=43137 RepID=A0A8S1X5I5_PAROT|nr:unnamed protein product [Paramecium octaurelia]
MQNFNKYCHQHPNKLANKICIDPNDIERKYCLICQFSHNADPSQFLSSFEFQEKYITDVRKKIEKYKKSNLSNFSKFNNIRKSLENQIECIQIKFEQVKQYIQDIEISLSIYENLFFKYSSPEEFSSDDLAKIINLKDGNELDKVEKKLKSFQSQFDEIQSCLINNLEKINRNLKFDFKLKSIRKKQDGQLWNNIKKRFTSIQFEIEVISGRQIKYLGNDGQILRIQNDQEISTSPEILNNLEQIKYLKWKGDYGKSNGRKGIWNASWNQKVLSNVGGFYIQGVKEGLWVDCAKGFCMNQACILEIGEYRNDFRIGKWSYEFDQQKINGGTYNLYSQKSGKWVEIKEGFHFYSQVTYVGEYQNDKKVGLWETWYKNHAKDQKNLQIGGGSYWNNIKVGKWIELSDGYYEYSQVTFIGEYKSGKKIGQWDICYKRRGKQQNQQIGGGNYDVINEGTKTGFWVEVSDEFYEDSQVINNGEYKNGKKVGRWDMLYRKGDRDQWNKQVGGGSYCNDTKIGEWTELSDGFRNISQVTYCGKYKNGGKIGRWDIWYRRYEGDEENHKIGGGSYNERSDGIKNGWWVELSDGFYEYSQVTYCGLYDQGRKLGRWDIWYKKHDEDQMNKQVGGGQYHDGIKYGMWTELSENFRKISQVILKGEYNFGQKVGRWSIFYKEEEKYKKIGGGQYDNGIKVSKWTEVSDVFGDNSQITFSGEYKKGQKIGIWDIWYRRYIDEPYKLIGGGLYDQFNNGIKIGYWIELSNGFKDYSQVTYRGKYQCNKKIGKWDIYYRYSVKLPFELMQYQIKQGKYLVEEDLMMKEAMELRLVSGLKYLMTLKI